MKKKLEKNYRQLAQDTGLQLDTESGALHGKRGGFELVGYAPDASYPYMLTLLVSATRFGEQLTKEEIKRFKQENPFVLSISQSRYELLISLRGTKKIDDLQKNLNSVLNAIASFLDMIGFRPCCQSCGEMKETDSYYTSGSYQHLCAECSREKVQKTYAKENVIAGMVGAFLGTVLGAVSIVVLGQLGFVAAISGIVMAVCALRGYEKMGGQLSKKGIVFSTILMIIMTLIGDRANWALTIAREWDMTFVEAFRAIPMLLQAQILDSIVYRWNLILLYVFVLVGAGPIVSRELKKWKKAGLVYRLNENSML